MFNISNNNNYSLFSIIHRSQLPDLSEHLTIINSSKSLLGSLNIDVIEDKAYRDESYKDLDKFYYLNFIPLDSFKLIVKDLLTSYKKDYPNGTIESFIEYKFNSLIRELELFKKLLTNELIDDWYSKGILNFYRYENSKPYLGFSFFLCQTESNDDIHFYKTYIDSILLFFESEIYSLTLKNNDENLEEKFQNEFNKKKNEAWFIVGVLFATGEMDELLKQFDGNATAVAKHLFPKNHDKYRNSISESKNDFSEGPKNIYNDNDKLKTIYHYCIQNNKKMTTSFINVIDSITGD